MTTTFPKSPLYHRRKKSSSFVLKALPSALALVFSQPGWAVDPTINVGGAAGLPLNGTVASGAATGLVAGNQLTIDQTSGRAVIDWTSFNIDAGKSVLFNQPTASSAVLNRVNGDANASQIMGNLSANGTVMLMNPNGIMFGANSVVNVGSLIATTGTISQSEFENHGHAHITGAAGNITNLGHITATAGASGLVALVAPSVINQKSITATGGQITLAGSTAATISLNGGLYEFAIPTGATGVQVSNTAAASLNAANIHIGVGDAANLLSGVINLEGVQQATNAIVVNGHTVELKSALQAPSVSGNSATVNVSSGARIQDAVDIAKTGLPGAGATVNVGAGTYAEQVVLNKANMTMAGAAGAKIVVPDAAEVNGVRIQANNVTVSGMEIAGPVSQPYYQYYAAPAPSNISRGIAVADGVTGFTIRNNNIHDVRNGILIHGRNSTGSVTDNRIENTKSGISVQYTDGAGITMAGNIQGPVGNEWGLNLHLNGHLDGSNNILSNTTPIAAAPTLAWQQSLLDLSTANGGWSVQDQAYTSSNRTHANVATTGSAGAQGSLLTPLGSIQDGVNAVVVGGKVSVAAGNYTGSVALNKTNVTLAGREGANLDVAEGQTGFDISANGVTVEGMQITGPYSQNFTTVNWNAVPSTTAIVLRENVSGARIRNNSIKNIRTGVQVLDHAAADITGNTFDNTKGSILVRSDHVTMSGNTRGPSGNEWDIVFLNHVTDGAYFVSPHVDQKQYGSGMMDMSRANGNMHILDRRYGSNGLLGSTPQFGNRTHIVVSAGSNFTAADDFNLGNGLGNARQPLGFIGDGINAVVSGGVVEVKAGTYAENVNITKALTIEGAGAGQSVIAPTVGDGVTVSGNIGATSEVLIGGFTFRNAPGSGVRVANNTVLNRLTVRNSDFLHNGKFGFFADGLTTAGIPGLQNVSLLNSTFTGNGAPYTSATSLGQGDINFNYYNGNATLKDLRITGENEFVGIQFRGYHDNVASGGVHDAGTLEFDNVTIEGSFRRPIGSAGTWNPQGPGDAIHLLEYGAVANVSFNNVAINPTVGHGMFLEGLGSTLDIGNTRFGVPDSTITGTGSNPTRSWNIYAGSNERNNVKTNVNATRASFTGAANGFAIEDRVRHALDVTGLGVVNWEAGNLYVTQASGSVQRGMDAASVGNTVNVDAGTYAEDLTVSNRYNFLFNDTRLHSLTLQGGAAGSGIGGAVTADGAGGFKINAPVNLLADTTLTTLGADISFNGDVQNASGVARALRLVAGTGGTRGNVHMTTGGSASSPLGQFDVSANQFSLASTLWVKGYKIDALGNVTLSNNTLRAQDAGAANTLNAGGNVTGSTISQGSVAVVSAGNIAANIAGTTVAAQAQGAMDVVVTASQTASLKANSIVANITATDVVAQSQGNMNVVVSASSTASLAGNSVVANVTAPVVGVEAVNDAQISGSASQITLDAPKGSVSGSFGQVSNTGGGLVNVNGKPQGNQTLSSNSENSRVVPVGEVGPGNEPGVRVARVGSPTAQRDGDVSLSTPEAAGDAIDSGQAVELDLSPRKSQDAKEEKSSEKEEQ